jgi:hypothetical protein
MSTIKGKIDRFTDQEKYELLHLIIDRVVVDYSQTDGHGVELELAIPILDATPKQTISETEVYSNQ